MHENHDSDEKLTERSRVPEEPPRQQNSALGQVTRRRLLASSGALVAGSAVGVSSASANTVRNDKSNTQSIHQRLADSAIQTDVSLDGIETFVDQHMADAVANGDVVGATAAAIHGDETVFMNGYGKTRVNGGDSVDADTQFRLGSVSKPVIWTAAMQLIESGRIDPDEDVRTYLNSVSIADTYNTPITMSHLATHTAGFESRNQGMWVSDPDDIRPLATVLDEEQPARVRPPGEITSYSNYGAALAGQVIANVASQPLAAYLDEHIFEPLGMSSATFEQPPPSGSVTGYTAALGTPTEAPGLSLELWPAGSLTASADDMSRFMRGHVADGNVDGERLLSVDGIHRMQDQWFTNHPAVDGVGFGWIENTHGDVRTLWHNGAILGSFYSHLLLIPEEDIGLFLAYNTDAGASAANGLIDDFSTSHIQQKELSKRKPSGRPHRADDLAGTYRGVRIAKTTHSRLFTTLQAGDVTTTVDDAGYLITEAGGETTRWVERKPLVFDEAEGNETLAFEATNDTVTHLYQGFQAFRRRSWFESFTLHGALGSGSTVGMLSGVLGWPALYSWRRFRGRNDQAENDTEQPNSTNASEPNPSERIEDSGGPEHYSETDTPNEQSDSSSAGPSELNLPTQARDHSSFIDRLLGTLDSPAVARWLLGGSITSVVAFAVGVSAGLLLNPTFLTDPPLWYQLLLVLPVLATFGTILSIGSAVMAWRSGAWNRWSLFHYSIVAISTGVACWLLYYWNLFGTPG